MITVITPCYNASAYIEEAIESVREQQYSSVEHIIVDGGSTDGTLDILERYPHLRVTSEPDNGLYDALNKGIAFARGDLIAWLNADDRFLPGAFSQLLSRYGEDKDVEMVCGACEVVDQRSRNNRANKVRWYFTPEHDFKQGRIRHTGGVLLNGCLFSTQLLDKVGQFNTKYQISADRDYLIRLALQRPACSVIDKAVYQYRQHDDSLTFGERSSDDLRSIEEGIDISRKYLRERDLSASLNGYCKRLLRSRSSSYIKSLALDYQYIPAFKYSLRICSDDPAFPIWAVKMLATKPLRYLLNLTHNHGQSRR